MLSFPLEVKTRNEAAGVCCLRLPRAAADQCHQPGEWKADPAPGGAASIQTKLPLNDFIESWFTS